MSIWIHCGFTWIFSGILTAHNILDWAVFPIDGCHCITPWPQLIARIATEICCILQVTIWEICVNLVVCMWLLGIPTLTGFACGSYVHTALVRLAIHEVTKTPWTSWKCIEIIYHPVSLLYDRTLVLSSLLIDITDIYAVIDPTCWWKSRDSFIV